MLRASIWQRFGHSERYQNKSMSDAEL